MITSGAFRGKRYAVLGLARSGKASVEALLASGAEVTAWDAREEPREPFAGRVTLADPLGIDLTGFDGVVVSPGVPLNTHPIAAKAREAGVPLIGDIELFALARGDLPPHRVVGITGTNGKSTTTALVHHILQTAGVPTTMGGNIGLPILGEEPLPAGGVYVLELSSYQLDLTHSLACEVAVLLNITPDHLDRYERFEDYANSKLRLFWMQWIENVAIAPSKYFHSDDKLAGVVSDGNSGRVMALEDVFSECPADTAFPSEGDQPQWPALQGPHNLQNACAAVGVGVVLSIPGFQIANGLRTFPGLPHRMERVGEYNSVLFVNDSKATNPASTAPALAAYPPNPNKRLHWIVGGLPKGDDLDECAPFFANVVVAYVIGEAGARFAELLAPHMRVERSEMLCEALRRAIAAAGPGEVVLLSPACASFDQFRDYEARGDAFRRLVHGLAGGGSVDPQWCAA